MLLLASASGALVVVPVVLLVLAGLDLQPPQRERHGHRGGHMGHGLLMIVCCIPMLVIAIVLVATSVVSASFLFAAIACTLMMAMMMGGMPHGRK